MKALRFLFAALAIALTTSISAQEPQQTPKPKKIYIIEGHFFNQIPVDNELTSGIIIINSANGTKAFGILLSEPLPDEALQYEVPKEQIPDAELLLEQYNDKAGSAISITMDKSESALKVGDAFPAFKATDIDGREWTNEDVKGTVMVLNCWFTGCGSCRAEMPELSKWKNEMPDVMFFSSTYEKPETARIVLEKTGFNWTPLVNDTQFKNYIGSHGYPLTVVVDKDGKIAQVEFGTSPLQRDKLKATIQSLR